MILIFGRSYGYSEEYVIKIISKRGENNFKKENLSVSSSEEKISFKENTFSICFNDIYAIIEVLLNNVEFFNEKELFYIVMESLFLITKMHGISQEKDYNSIMRLLMNILKADIKLRGNQINNPKIPFVNENQSKINKFSSDFVQINSTERKKNVKENWIENKNKVSDDNEKIKNEGNSEEKNEKQAKSITDKGNNQSKNISPMQSRY